MNTDFYKRYMSVPYSNEDMERVRKLARKYIEKAVLKERENKK